MLLTTTQLFTIGPLMKRYWPWLWKVGLFGLGGLLFFSLMQSAAKKSAIEAGQGDLRDRISLGEDLLDSETTTLSKKAGIKAFAQGNYLMAVQEFQQSLIQEPKDPETLIYLNNARSLVTGEKTLRIAVSVPLGKNRDLALEILRGVAQAQDSINDFKINGSPLEIVIAADKNDPKLAKQVAQTLVADPDIIAVVGHNASQASMAGAPVYQAGGLVMISPTSFVNELTGFGNYIFRTIPSIQAAADVLATHVAVKEKKKNLFVCIDKRSPDTQAFVDSFDKAFTKFNGRLITGQCEMAPDNFNAKGAIEKALAAQADGIVISPYISGFDRLFALAEANRGQLMLLTSPSPYSSSLLKKPNSGALVGLTLSAPWYSGDYSTTSFLAKSQQRWGADAITWRTATAFDATQAIATALREMSPTQPLSRSTLQQQLRQPTFQSQGAGEPVQFLPTGDRAGKATVIQVERTPQGGLQFGPVR